jgi:hypothetical protein
MGFNYGSFVMEPFILSLVFIKEYFTLSLNSYSLNFDLYNYWDILEVVIVNSYIHKYSTFFGHMDYVKFLLIDLDYLLLNTYLIFDQL